MKICIATLDADGVYRGLREVARKDVKPSDIEVPADCDLEPGKYLWNETEQRFDPVREDTPDSRLAEPNVQFAIAAGFMALAEQGAVLPKETRDWLTWYRQTLDGNGMGRKAGKVDDVNA